MPAPKVNSEKTPTIGDRYVNATEKLENSPRTRLSWGLYPRLASLASSSSVIAEVVGVASCIEVLLSLLFDAGPSVNSPGGRAKSVLPRIAMLWRKKI